MPAPNPQAPARPPLRRLAGRIRDQILAGRRDPPPGLIYALDTLTARATHLAAVRRRWDLCRRHRLALAAAHMQEELRDLLRTLPHEVEQVARQFPPVPEERLPLGELVEELKHLEEEFGPWRYEPAARELLVTTEPVVLEDRHFGAFEIRLSLERLGRGAHRGEAYKVVALDPHPAASNAAVTHPHVSEEHLCEGEASAPIAAALAEGRVADFFILVRCVLTTYNPSSPYVALDQWEGTPCHECGAIADDDNRHYCERCDHDFCDDCVSYCRCCDTTRCHSCLEDCPVCEESTCADCLETCSVCGKLCCTSCLEESRCPECRKAPEQPDQGDAHEPDSCTPAGGGDHPIAGDPSLRATAPGAHGGPVAPPASVCAVADEPAGSRAPRPRRTRRAAPRRSGSRTRRRTAAPAA